MALTADSLVAALKQLADGQEHEFDLDMDELEQELVFWGPKRRERSIRLSTPPDLLDYRRIRDRMSIESRSRFPQLEVVDVTGSTNVDLMLRSRSEDIRGTFRTAEMQTRGRGRRGAVWLTPPSCQLAVSYGASLPLLSQVSGFSVVVGYIVASVLMTVGCEGVGVKWPNDVVCAKGKLAGVMVEIPSTEEPTAVVGIGINMHVPAALRRAVEQPIAGVHEICRKRITRNELLAELTNQITDAFELYRNRGMGAFLDSWQAIDVLVGHEVQVIQNGTVALVGIAEGVAGDGSLMVMTEAGMQNVYAGEVSVRKH